jgi:hypothetical protein
MDIAYLMIRFTEHVVLAILLYRVIKDEVARLK